MSRLRAARLPAQGPSTQHTGRGMVFSLYTINSTKVDLAVAESEDNIEPSGWGEAGIFFPHRFVPRNFLLSVRVY